MLKKLRNLFRSSPSPNEDEIRKMTAHKSPPDANENIKQAIEYYKSLQSENGPGYAIMISGEWGTGKTYTVRKIVSELDKADENNETNSSKPKTIWISLYGLSDCSQIDYEIFRQMHPLMSNPKVKLLAKVGKGMLKGTLKIDLDGDENPDGTANVGLPDIDLSDFSDPKKAGILVFDDLERSNFEHPEQILGYINSLVEVNGLKVIIIANDNKLIEKHSEYKNIKEKLVGNTYEIIPDIENAIDTIIESLQGEAKVFLKCRRKELFSFCEKFKDSKEWEKINFRCLNRALFDYQNIHSKIDKSIISHDREITQFFCLFLILSYFTKKGVLGRSELEKLNGLNGYFRLDKERKDTVNKVVEAWEHTAGNRETFVEIDDWVKALVEGNPAKLIQNLKEAAAFKIPEKEHSWITVWHGLNREEKEFEKAVKKLVSEIKKRKYKSRGELLHIIGLSIWLKNDIYPEPKTETDSANEKHKLWQEIFDNWNEYINDVRKYLSLSLNEYHFNDFSESFFGMGIICKNTDEFKALNKYINQISSERTLEKIITEVSGLAKNIPNDWEGFFRAVCFTSHPGNSYPSIPILHNIDAEVFVEYLLSTPAKSFRNALMFFNARYEPIDILEKLEPEYDWFQKVYQKLAEKRDASAGIERERINNGMRLYVEPAKNQWAMYKEYSRGE
nr:P-loop NTPase fold protein [uncultured Cohaesibacter sp.]